MQLRVDRLACRRGGRDVFRGVGFALEAGEALVVSGRNGIGKSTLLAALAGLVRPSAGAIELRGSGERSLPECAHHLGHRDALKSALTARENLHAAAAILGARRMASGHALAAVGLPGADDLPAGHLSAGQRRRVALARLLVAFRPVWLLDEPLTALDADAQAMLAGLLRDHLAGGGILVAATHAPLPIPGARQLTLARTSS